MDGGAWWAAVHGVAKSRIRLSDFTFTMHLRKTKRITKFRITKTIFLKKSQISHYYDFVSQVLDCEPGNLAAIKSSSPEQNDLL